MRSGDFVPKGRQLGLQAASDLHAARIERSWRMPVVAALLATIPAFYAEMLLAEAPLAATAAYLAAAAVTTAALVHTALSCAEPGDHMKHNWLDVVLVLGLLVAAALPPSHHSQPALVIRLAVSMLTLARMVWAVARLVTRGSIVYTLLIALVVLGLCGVGYWWLEPTTKTFGDGLWLAFVTAATVGYGDFVPTTPASRIFSFFVVMLGFGVLSLITATIAATLVESEERRIEREILRDLHRQLDQVRADLAALRAEMRAAAHLLTEERERGRARPHP